VVNFASHVHKAVSYNCSRYDLLIRDVWAPAAAVLVLTTAPLRQLQDIDDWRTTAAMDRDRVLWRLRGEKFLVDTSAFQSTTTMRE